MDEFSKMFPCPHFSKKAKNYDICGCTFFYIKNKFQKSFKSYQGLLIQESGALDGTVGRPNSSFKLHPDDGRVDWEYLIVSGDDGGMD